VTEKDKKPFAPKYATKAEYLFDLARWYANQEKLPTPEDVSGDFQYMNEVDDFRDRVFALMVGSEVSLKPGYWLTNLDGSNPTKLTGSFHEALDQALALSTNNKGVTYRLLRQYVHSLKTISERVGLVVDGELYEIRRLHRFV
jgi:hypothetical protein